MIKEIDIQKGDMTYSQRTELGKILTSDTTEIEKFTYSIRCLHKVELKPRQYATYLPYFLRIVEGIGYWAKAEQNLLRYEPTIEEQQAGITDYSEKVQELGTVVSLARSFSTDPDTVLDWKYSKVFGILYADLEQAKFQRRLDKVITKKYK